MDGENLPTLSLTFLHYLDETLNQLTDLSSHNLRKNNKKKGYGSTSLDLDSEHADWMKGVSLCKQTNEQIITLI